MKKKTTRVWFNKVVVRPKIATKIANNIDLNGLPDNVLSAPKGNFKLLVMQVS